MTAEVAKEKGYRVNNNTGGGYEVTYEDGYKSWCPKDVFEKHNFVVKNEVLAKTCESMVSPDYKERLKEDILLRAGFIEKEGVFGCSTEIEGRKRIIVVALDGSAMYGRDYTLIVHNGHGDPIGYACVQTTGHFNKLMDLMDIDFKLKEE